MNDQWRLCFSFDNGDARHRYHGPRAPLAMLVAAALLAPVAAAVDRPSGLSLGVRAATEDAIYLPLVLRDALPDSVRPVPPPVSTPTEPTPAPDPSTWTAVSDFVIGGPAWAVDVDDGVAFVGIGAHLVAFDVSADGDPKLVGASPPLPGNVRDVVVLAGLAYAAVHQTMIIDDAPGGLFVLDVSDPGSIEVLGSGAIHGGADTIAVDGKRAVLLATESRSWGAGGRERFLGIVAFDVSDPAAPALEAEATIEHRRGDVVVAGDVVFLCDPDSVLSILEIRGGLDASITPPSTIGERCAGLAFNVERDRLFAIADEGEFALRTYDLEDPLAPDLISSINIAVGSESRSEFIVRDVSVEGSLVNVGGWDDHRGGVVVAVDVSAPGRPEPGLPIYFDHPVLGVDSEAGRVVLALATAVPYESWDSVIRVLNNEPEASDMGSEIVVYPRVPAAGSVAVGRFAGPGSLLTVLAAHGRTGYALESGIRGAMMAGRLWAFEVEGGYPKFAEPLEIEDGDLYFTLESGAFSASAAGLFVAAYDLYHFRVEDGALRALEPIGGGEAVYAEDDLVFAAFEGGYLTIHDISGPIPRLVSELDLPFRDPSRLERAGDLLWVVSSREPWSTFDRFAGFDDDLGRIRTQEPNLALIDIGDPSSPRLMGTMSMPAQIGQISVRGRLAHLFLGEEGWLFQIATVRSLEGGGPPEEVARLDLRGSVDFGVNSTDLATTSDRMWLADGLLRFGIRALDARILTMDSSDPESLRVLGDRLVPAAIRARRLTRYDDRSDEPGAVGLLAGDGIVLGSVHDAGVFGFAP